MFLNHSSWDLVRFKEMAEMGDHVITWSETLCTFCSFIFMPSYLGIKVSAFLAFQPSVVLPIHFLSVGSESSECRRWTFTEFTVQYCTRMLLCNTAWATVHVHSKQTAVLFIINKLHEVIATTQSPQLQGMTTAKGLPEFMEAAKLNLLKHAEPLETTVGTQQNTS